MKDIKPKINYMKCENCQGDMIPPHDRINYLGNKTSNEEYIQCKICLSTNGIKRVILFSRE